jgi:hypothetical protein
VHVWESPLRHSLSGRLLGSARITEISELTEDLDEILASSAREQAEEGAELARRRGLEARAEVVESAAGVWRALIKAAGSTGAGVVSESR